MYAVIETGGKQYRVEVGTELEVELLDVEPGKKITIERVLLVADGDDSTIGRPLVADAEVSAEVLNQTRGPKLISFKYRPKARSRVKKGHRQDLTVLRIADITFGGKSAAKLAEMAERDAKTERERLEEAASVQAAKDAELAAKLAVGAEAKPAKATAAKADTSAKAKAEPRGKAETATKAKADAKPAASKPAAKTTAAAGKAKTETKSAGTRSASAKTESPAKADAPKKPRTTKKDE
jgi:large subunit ribosomal protein L21